MTAPVPHNPVAEREVIGGLLMWDTVVAPVLDLLGEDDFHVPSMARYYRAITTLHRGGRQPNPLTTVEQLTEWNQLRDGDDQELVLAMKDAPARSSILPAARVVADLSTLRQIVKAGEQLMAIGLARGDAADSVDQVRSVLGGIVASAGFADVTVVSLDDLVEEESDPADWVIPGLLTRSDRVLLVAGEGHGKTTLFRQIAVMCGQGIHPFAYWPIPPVRTLLVDLENPRDIIRDQCQPLLSMAHTRSTYKRDQALLWQQPAGIDVRTRTGFASLEAAIRIASPDLVCLGPLYKLFRQRQGESMEDAALDVASRLDDLRTRHRFALFLEHHAPKGVADKARELIPFGSSVWLRWPEFGPKLTPVSKEDRSLLNWGEWRAPRADRPWPSRLSRGQTWPWEASWKNGAPKRPGDEGMF